MHNDIGWQGSWRFWTSEEDVCNVIRLRSDELVQLARR
jgi:hypothetical protein